MFSTAARIASLVISWNTMRLHRDLRLQRLEQVPRDGLALAVLICGEQDFVGCLERALEFGDGLRLAVVDDVVGVEVVVDVDRVLAVRLFLSAGMSFLLARSRMCPTELSTS